MARKDAYWFPHDANAGSDPKILAMRSVYGFEGYGWFWSIIELLRNQTGYKLPRDKYLNGILAMHMQSSCETSAKYLQDLLDEFHLLSTDDEFVWSESLCRRMEGWDKVTENHRQAALKRWGKNAEQMQGTCGADARHMQEQGNKEHNRRKHRNRAVSIAQMEHKQRIKDAVQQDMAQIAKEFDNETD